MNKVTSALIIAGTILWGQAARAQVEDLPILHVVEVFEKLLGCSQVVPRNRYSEADREELTRFRAFLKSHPVPQDTQDFEKLGVWVVRLAKELPTVLLSLELTKVPDESWVFEKYNFRLDGLAYSSAEALLPIAFLRLLYDTLFPKNPLNVDYPDFDPAPGSIHFSPLTLALVEAVEHASIHVMTVELKAYILLRLYLAPDAAFQKWSGRGKSSKKPQKSPEMVRKKIAQVLASEYWITSNSELMQGALLHELAWIDNFHHRALFLRAVEHSSFVLFGGEPARIEKILSRLVQELPSHLRALSDKRRAGKHLEFIVSVFELAQDTQGYTWVSPQMKKSGQALLDMLRSHQQGRVLLEALSVVRRGLGSILLPPLSQTQRKELLKMINCGFEG